MIGVFGFVVCHFFGAKVARMTNTTGPLCVAAVASMFDVAPTDAFGMSSLTEYDEGELVVYSSSKKTPPSFSSACQASELITGMLYPGNTSSEGPSFKWELAG